MALSLDPQLFSQENHTQLKVFTTNYIIETSIMLDVLRNHFNY